MNLPVLLFFGRTQLPVSYYPLFTFTNYTFQKGTLLKEDSQHEAKQKAFFRNNVNIVVQGTYYKHTQNQ